MRNFKRALTWLLTLVLTVAMAANAAAAGAGSITVENPVDGSTYQAYKIFDVEYSDDKSAYAYTIQADSDWLDAVRASGMVELAEAAGQPDVYVVTAKDNFSAAGFAAALKDQIAGKTGITMPDGKATGLDLGYYLVVPTNAEGKVAICNLTTTQPAATIHDKNDVSFEKVDDKADVQVGEVVTYTVTGKVPDTTGFTTYTYEISDSMSNGLTFNNDVRVTVNGQSVDGKYTLSTTANGFKVVFEVMQMQDLAGQEIRLLYTATVNEQAVAVISKNHATLKYSNDPTDTSKTTTITDEETVYSAEIVIDKHKTGADTEKLAGAKFVLKNADGKYYTYDGQKVDWVDAQEDATVHTTTDNGAATFKGLKNGTYSLIETEAPKGYNLLADPVSVTINGTDANVGSLTVTEKVANSTGTVLPGTGGIGTTIFYTLGGLLAVGAAVLLIAKKRMSHN